MGIIKHWTKFRISYEIVRVRGKFHKSLTAINSNLFFNVGVTRKTNKRPMSLNAHLRICPKSFAKNYLTKTLQNSSRLEMQQ